MSEPAAAAPSAPPAPKKSATTLIVVVGVVLVVVGGAGGGAFWWMRRSVPKVEAAPKVEKAGERGIVPFEPFVVNLADPGGSHFLRISVQIVLANAEEAEKIHKTPVLVMQARSAILDLLTQQTADVIATPEGKKALKTAIAAHVGAALGGVKAHDVLFSDFVIQY